MNKTQWKTAWNVKKSEEDICLHQTKKGAIKCQSKRGGEVVREEADYELFKEIEK